MKLSPKNNPAAREEELYGIHAGVIASELVAQGPRRYRHLDPLKVAERGRALIRRGYNPWRAAAYGYAVMTAEHDEVRGWRAVTRANRVMPIAERFARWRPSPHHRDNTLTWYAYKLADEELSVTKEATRWLCISMWFCLDPIEFSSLEEFRRNAKNAFGFEPNIDSSGRVRYYDDLEDGVRVFDGEPDFSREKWLRLGANWLQVLEPMEVSG